MSIVKKTYQQFSRIKSVILINKNFLLLWLAQVCTQSAVSIISILVGILSHEGVLSVGTKESSMGIGVILIMATLPGLIVAPIAGVFADWFSKKSIMISSNIVRVLILVVFVLVRGWEQVWISYALVFILSTVLQFFIPAEGGLIPVIVQKRYLLLANSLFSLTVYTTLAVGMFFSGLLLNILGVEGTFIACGILFLVSSLFLFKVKVVEAIRQTRSLVYLFDFVKDLISDVRKGLIYSFKERLLRFALMHLFILQIGGLMLVTLIFKIGSEIYNVSPRTAGIVVVVPTVVGLLSGLGCLNLVGRNRSRGMLIWIGTILSSVGFGLMSIISLANGILVEYLLDKVVATASLIAIGWSIPFLLIPAQTLIYEQTQADFRGRVLGIWLALTSSLASLVAIFVGFLTDRIGDLSIPIMLVVILDIIYSILLSWLLKKGQI